MDDDEDTKSTSTYIIDSSDSNSNNSENVSVRTDIIIASSLPQLKTSASEGKLSKFSKYHGKDSKIPVRGTKSSIQRMQENRKKIKTRKTI